MSVLSIEAPATKNVLENFSNVWEVNWWLVKWLSRWPTPVIELRLFVDSAVIS